MNKKRSSSQEIQDFIIDNVAKHPDDIARLTCEHFNLSRQAVNRHMGLLFNEGRLIASGRTRSRSYKLINTSEGGYEIEISDRLAEDRVWRDKIAKHLPGLAPNLLEICHYGFTEILNNVISHSRSRKAYISVVNRPDKIALMVADYGVGIFNKLIDAKELDDERHAILELAKGKLTTHSQGHSGDGIFFTSRLFDHFTIASGEYIYEHSNDGLATASRGATTQKSGTVVTMELSVRNKQTLMGLFKGFAARDVAFSFSRTEVPVALARYEDGLLISRSQARRMLVRLERFDEILFDFSGVEMIAHPFADELFRVFSINNPDIKLSCRSASEDIVNMIGNVLIESDVRPPDLI